MVVYLSPFAGAGWQFFDDNGVPLSGGKLYTYNAGTTSLTPTYTDKYGTVANTNPIILDSAGRIPYEIWLTLGLDYKFIVKTATDTLIRTYDYISLNAVFNSGVINTVGYFDHTGAFNTSNNFTFNDLTNTLSVTGNISSSTLGVTGNTTVGGTLGVTGNTTVGGTLGVTGNTTVGGTLGVTGNTTVGGTLGVTGVLSATSVKTNSGAYSNALTAPTTLSTVVITGTAGQFSCSSTILYVGQQLTISGVFGGTGSITGYSNPTTYYIIATNGTTTFTLSATSGGSAITTTAGTPTGLTYTLGTTYTLYSFANTSASTWLVNAYISGMASATGYSCVGIVTTQGSTAVYTSIKTATSLTISISGLNLQASQTSGSTKDISWNILQLS